MSNLIIIGASGHGRVIADIARLYGYEEICFLDDNTAITSLGNYEVIGTTADIENVDGDFFVGIGDPKVRKSMMEKLEQNEKSIPILVHPSAVIGEDVTIEKGTVVMAGAVINPGTSIGQGVIINTSSSVDHDCKIGDYAHIAVGAHVCGTVEIGESTWIGAGATVSNNITICGDCMIGAGAVVVKDINKSGTFIGVPAKDL